MKKNRPRRGAKRRPVDPDLEESINIAAEAADEDDHAAGMELDTHTPGITAGMADLAREILEPEKPETPPPDPPTPAA